MNNNRRRNFRPRSQKNNFRRRGSSISSNSTNNFNNNGNVNFGRNGSMNNIHNVEKTMLKFQQLAKDAQSNGDPVLAQNYLQHADHYLRRYNELNERKENTLEKSKIQDSLSILTKNKTTIVIAHRLSTILNSSNIYVIDSGNMVASGSHEELLKNSDLYKNFYEKQIQK